MRKGQNPAKDLPSLGSYKRHRVIIPIYLPSFKGYFQHSLEILNLCLQSLRLTATNEDAITLISNGCAVEVRDYLLRIYEEGWIDQLVINQENHGKIDAITSAARGAYEGVITFADCDAFFYPGWQNAVIEIFNTFPEAGWVSTMPSPVTTRLNTASTIWDAFTCGLLFRKQVVAADALNRFGESIDQADMYRSQRNTHYLAVKRKSTTAIVGGGHFCFSIRREVLLSIPPVSSSKFIAEEDFFGQPFDQAGYWRLSTPDLYVQHMGNVPEEWMYEDLQKNRTNSTYNIAILESQSQRTSPLIPYKIRLLFLRAFKKLNLSKFLPECR